MSDIFFHTQERPKETEIKTKKTARLEPQQTVNR